MVSSETGPSRVAHETDDHSRRKSLTLSIPSNLPKFNQLWSQFIVDDLHQDEMISTGIKETTNTLRICRPCLPSLPFVPPSSSSITSTVASRHSKRYTNNTEERMLSMSTTSVVSFGSETKILDSSLTSIHSSSSSSSSASFKSRNNVRWAETMVVCGHKYTDIRSNGQHVSYTGQVHSTTQVPHGKGTLQFADGRLFHGEWHHGKLISLHSPPRPPALNGSRHPRGTLQRNTSGASAA